MVFFVTADQIIDLFVHKHWLYLHVVLMGQTPGNFDHDHHLLEVPEVGVLRVMSVKICHFVWLEPRQDFARWLLRQNVCDWGVTFRSVLPRDGSPQWNAPFVLGHVETSILKRPWPHGFYHVGMVAGQLWLTRRGIRALFWHAPSSRRFLFITVPKHALNSPLSQFQTWLKATVAGLPKRKSPGCSQVKLEIDTELAVARGSCLSPACRV